ncbi:MAG TPA: o-succinylbenzoate synthase [Acidimicrobiia bacterium]|jgi:O-succinylbenzoate synthase
MTRAFHVRLPLRTPLGGLEHRDAVLVEGRAGWGEWSPLPGYPSDPRNCWAACQEATSEPWPVALRHQVPVNALVPAVEAQAAGRLAAEAKAAGIWTVKVKVGADPAGADLDRVAAVRDALGPDGRIRIDANACWDLDDAVLALFRFEKYDIELAEQPVASLEDLARLRRRAPVPVAADEAVRTLEDAYHLHKLGAADALVVKTQPLGGVRPALAIVEVAGVPAIVSSLYETSVGLAAGLALAACLPDLPYACGLGTAGLLAADVVADPLVPVDGMLTVRRPVPDPDLLAAYGAPLEEEP